jgi:hypothetical protein
VLTEPERVPEEVWAFATAVERLDLTKQRPVRPCERPPAPSSVQTQYLAATWSLKDLNLVCMSGCAAAQHRVERLALDRPVGSGCDRQHVAHDALGRHAACPPVSAREQRLISLAFVSGNRLRLR